LKITVKQLSYFIAVAEAGSIAGALPTLNVSQSVVTEAIHKLEGTLGTPLFVRHARGMGLTHAGHQFLRHAEAVMAALESAERSIRARPDTVQGTLNLGVGSLVTAYYLPELLSRFERVFPGVSVNVTEDRRQDIEHRLIGGELDLAVMNVASYGTGLDRQAIETRTLIRAPWLAWLPGNHPLLSAQTVSLSQLRGERLLTLKSDELEDGTRQILALGGLKAAGLRTSSTEALRSLVALGLGVAVLPSLLYRPWSLEGDRLASRPISESLPPLEVGVAWRRGSPLSAVAEQFLVVVGEHARTHGTP
jgi:DNA-binding transcriptional LysR family regulator